MIVSSPTNSINASTIATCSGYAVRPAGVAMPEAFSAFLARCSVHPSLIVSPTAARNPAAVLLWRISWAVAVTSVVWALTYTTPSQANPSRPGEPRSASPATHVTPVSGLVMLPAMHTSSYFAHNPGRPGRIWIDPGTMVCTSPNAAWRTDWAPDRLIARPLPAPAPRS